MYQVVAVILTWQIPRAKNLIPSFESCFRQQYPSSRMIALAVQIPGKFINFCILLKQPHSTVKMYYLWD